MRARKQANYTPAITTGMRRYRVSVSKSERLTVPSKILKTSGYRDTKRLASLVNFFKSTNSLLPPLASRNTLFSTSRDVRRRCFDVVHVVRARAPPHAASGFFFGDAVGDLVRHLHHPRLLEDAACRAFAKGGPEPGQICLGLRARNVQGLGLGR